MKIAISGWFNYPHSFSYVNLEHIRSFLSNDHYKIYFNERAPLFDYWMNSSSPMKDKYFSHIKSSIKPAYSALSYDVSIDIAVPPIAPQFIAKKKILFLVSEYDQFQKNYLYLAGGENNLLKITESYDNIITPSYWSKKALLNAGIRNDIIKVVPHGVNKIPENLPKEEIKRKFRHKNNIKDNEMLLLNIGTTTFNKGMDVILESVIKCKYYGNIYLVLKGNDDIYSSKSSFTELLKSVNPSFKDRLNIIYVGNTLSKHEMMLLMLSCDAYISPFRAEGFNIPVAEAFRYKMKLIATKAPPVTEFVDDDNGVYWVEATLKSKESGSYFVPDIESCISCINKAYEDFLHDGLNKEHQRCDKYLPTWNDSALAYLK